MSTHDHYPTESDSQLTTTDAEPRPEAHVCGRLGCRETDDLARYRDGNGRERVLCPSCGRAFLGGAST